MKRARRIRVLSVASEIFPLVKTGGLADVAGALPSALAVHGVEMRSLIPGYPAVLDKLGAQRVAHRFPDLMGGAAELLTGDAAGLDLAVLKAPHLYERSGNPYVDASGRDWPDNAQRFGALSLAAAEIAGGCIPGYRPDIVHAHDWQAGLAPAYLRYGGTARSERVRTVITVHNLAFQGHFPAALLGSLRLPPTALQIDGIEYFGGIGFLKAGLQFADRITTVSPTYAAEIQTRDGGMGLDGLLRFRADAVSGIVNGIDTGVWDPANDPQLPVRFSAARPAGRKASKNVLRERFGIRSAPDAPLFAVISRLTEQKGMDLLAAALPTLMASGGDLVLVGAGDSLLEQAFRMAEARHPGRVGVFIGYDEALAHLVQGGADALLVPSRFEPCGLTQLCALRYGAVPIVARVGGLNDTVIDANEAALAAGVATGFQFAPVTGDALERTLVRTVEAWRTPKLWKAIQANGMAADVSWARPAAHYAALYRSLMHARTRRPSLNS